jgi:hypothetical protein
MACSGRRKVRAHDETEAMNPHAKFVGGIVIAAAVCLGAVGEATAQGSGAIPRMADGKPDLSGIWWTGGDLGSAGYNSSRQSGGAGPGGRGAGGPPPVRVEDLYQDWAKAHAATLSDKDDPTLQCRPTAFGTLNVRLFDVGTLGQIVAKPGMMTFLQETFHGYQQIPTDGRPHRDYIPSATGKAIPLLSRPRILPTTPGCMPKAGYRFIPMRSGFLSVISSSMPTR